MALGSSIASSRVRPTPRLQKSDELAERAIWPSLQVHTAHGHAHGTILNLPLQYFTESSRWCCIWDRNPRPRVPTPFPRIPSHHNAFVEHKERPFTLFNSLSRNRFFQIFEQPSSSHTAESPTSRVPPWFPFFQLSLPSPRLSQGQGGLANNTKRKHFHSFIQSQHLKFPVLFFPRYPSPTSPSHPPHNLVRHQLMCWCLSHVPGKYAKFKPSLA